MLAWRQKRPIHLWELEMSPARTDMNESKGAHWRQKENKKASGWIRIPVYYIPLFRSISSLSLTYEGCFPQETISCMLGPCHGWETCNWISCQSRVPECWIMFQHVRNMCEGVFG